MPVELGNLSKWFWHCPHPCGKAGGSWRTKAKAQEAYLNHRKSDSCKNFGSCD